MKNVKIAVSLIVILLISSCGQEDTQAERNKAKLIKAHDELLTKGNLAYADDHFVDNYGGKGPELIKEFVKQRKEAFPDYQFKLEPVVAEGNMVAWLRTNTGTQRKDYHGIHATGKKVTWREMVMTRYTADGKIEEEWTVGDAYEMLPKASAVEGVFEYLPPLKGHGINRNGKFVYLFGPSDGNNPMMSSGGNYEIVGDSVKNIITYHTNPKQIGVIFYWKIKSWVGDTISFETMNDKGVLTGSGRAIRVSY